MLLHAETSLIKGSLKFGRVLNFRYRECSPQLPHQRRAVSGVVKVNEVDRLIVELINHEGRIAIRKSSIIIIS